MRSLETAAGRHQHVAGFKAGKLEESSQEMVGKNGRGCQCLELRSEEGSAETTTEQPEAEELGVGPEGKCRKYHLCQQRGRQTPGCTAGVLTRDLEESRG